MEAQFSIYSVSECIYWPERVWFERAVYTQWQCLVLADGTTTLHFIPYTIMTTLRVWGCIKTRTAQSQRDVAGCFMTRRNPQRTVQPFGHRCMQLRVPTMRCYAFIIHHTTLRTVHDSGVPTGRECQGRAYLDSSRHPLPCSCSQEQWSTMLLSVCDLVGLICFSKW